MFVLKKKIFEISFFPNNLLEIKKKKTNPLNIKPKKKIKEIKKL